MSITDADVWLKRTGLPYWSLAAFREMKVNEILVLIDFVGPGFSPTFNGSASVGLFKRRGYWTFEALWMLGANTTIFCPDVRFKILPGRKLQWLQQDNGARLIRLMLHRACVLANMAQRDGDLKAMAAMHPMHFKARSRPGFRSERDALEWLQSRRDTLKWLAKDGSDPDSRT